ncbi:hypothetical protein MAIT1_03364 [Magnetofaba australis IT-1]|uniref:Uncharacterized protein n=1 Tax=Magnetofaba australis IT-1 TaxID=1434232 RepID=A0A1Y2K6A4_9PROT|nr:hypothetical protein MAIT1_03364 [Magnetofaba australis IT-1]
MADGAHGQQVGGGAGADEDAVFDAQPLGPLLLERAHFAGLGQSRHVLFEEFDQIIEVFAQDIVNHQGPFHCHIAP